MPRDGSNIYHRPPGTDGIPDTTIESARYNVFVADVEQDLNAPRPIIAGGTGATSTTAAMVALRGEVALQLVDNYDTFPFVTGSFSSVSGATSAPLAGTQFYGQAIVWATSSSYMMLVCRIQGAVSNGITYVREMNAGVWGAWTTIASPNDGVNKVSKAGDTMSGALTINSTLNATGNITAPTFISNGTNFLTSDGTNLIARTNGAFYVQNTSGGMQTLNAGNISLTGSVTAAGNVVASGNVTASNDLFGKDFHANRGDGTGVVFFGPSNYLYWDNSNFNLTNPLVVNGTLTAGGDAHLNGGTTFANAITCSSLSCSGGVSFGSVAANPVYVNNGNSYLTTDGVGLIARTASWFYVQNTGGGAAGIQCNGVVAGDYLQANGNITAGGDLSVGSAVSARGYLTRQGFNGGYNGSKFNIDWPGDNTSSLWIDDTRVSVLANISDYRTKKDVVDLPAMWETVKALRPIKYSHAEFSPPSHIENFAGKEGEAPPPLFVDSDIEHWGFIAHELQETLTASAASGVKDSPDTIQSPNPFTLIAALTKALQEAMVRIEKLEGAARKR